MCNSVYIFAVKYKIADNDNSVCGPLGVVIIQEGVTSLWAGMVDVFSYNQTVVGLLPRESAVSSAQKEL